MKNLLFRFKKQNIQMITKLMMVLVSLGIFGSPAYSQIVAPSVTICGEMSVTLHVTSHIGYSASDLNWYSVPFYGTSLGTGVDYITPVLTKNTTYYVDALIDGVGICNRTPVAVTLSTTTVVASIFYASGTYCNSLDEDQTPTITGSTGGVYSVTPVTASPLIVNSSTGIFNPHNVTPGTYTITYHITNQSAGCTEEDCTAQVIINVPPSEPGISYTGSPWCTTAGVKTVTQTGPDPILYPGTYSCSPSGLFIDSHTGQITPASSLPGAYEVTYLVGGSGGCSPQHAHANVTITGLPTAAISYTGTPFCKDISSAQTPGLTGTGAYTGGIYSYSGTGTLASFNTGTGVFTPSTSDAGTYTIYYTAPASGNCATVQVSTSITINPLPHAAIAGDATVCEGAASPNVTFTGSLGTAPYTFTYKVNAGLDLTVITSSGNSVTVAQPTTTAGTFIYTLVSVTDAHGCSHSESGSATITVTSTPVATFVYSGSPYCRVGTASPTFTGGGTAGTFSGTNVVFVSTSTGEINLASTTAGTYEITNTISSCGGVHEHATVIIQALPDAGITGTLTACVTTTLTATTGASSPIYIWYKFNTGTSLYEAIAGQTESTLLVDASGNYKVKVTDGSTGCESTSEPSTVVINPSPTASITGTLEACATTTLTAVSGASLPTYIWYKNDVEISGQTASTLVVTASGLYKVKITKNGCENTSDISTVNIYPATVAGTVTGGTTICSGSTSSLLTLDGYTGSITGWESAVSPFTTWTPIANTIPTYTSGALAATTQFRAVVQSGVCEAGNSAVTTVTVNPLPAIDLTIGGTGSICYRTGTNITVASSVVGTSYQLRSEPADALVGEAVAGNGGTISLPTGNLTTTTTFNVLATITATTCSAELTETEVVTVTGCVATLTTTAVTAITSTTATGGGNISNDGGSVVSPSGICWGTLADPTISGSKTTDGAAIGSFTGSITGLTLGTTYHVRAYATNSTGTAYGNDVSFTATLAIGESYGGGKVFRITGTFPGLGCLIATSSDQSTGMAWSNIQNALIGTTETAIGTGAANTVAIIGQAGHTNSAAKLCDDLVENTYSDWYLPSIDELGSMISNNIAAGLGMPSSQYYWSSSENSDTHAAVWNVNNGVKQTSAKSSGYHVRAIRSFPAAPIAGTHVPSQTQIIWNWNTVEGATGYKWNTTNNYSEATDMSTAVSKTETGLSCSNAETSYVWAYAPGFVSSVTTLYSATTACCTPLNIGDSYQGGIIIYLTGTCPHQEGIIAAPTDVIGGSPWGNEGTMAVGNTGIGIGTGEKNTGLIYAKYANYSSAAKACWNYHQVVKSESEYNDWYLPSIDELSQLYTERYHLSGIESESSYWSSSEYSEDLVKGMSFMDGTVNNTPKQYSAAVRPIRSFSFITPITGPNTVYLYAFEGEPNSIQLANANPGGTWSIDAQGAGEGTASITAGGLLSVTTSNIAGPIRVRYTVTIEGVPYSVNRIIVVIDNG